jgi:predicted metalloprotease with PDZ domain
VRFLTLCLSLVLAHTAAAQPLRLSYHVALPDPATHLYDVSLAVDGVRGATLPLQMPVWSPGRYAKMDFARNVQEFRATDAAGRPLRWD